MPEIAGTAVYPRPAGTPGAVDIGGKREQDTTTDGTVVRMGQDAPKGGGMLLRAVGSGVLAGLAGVVVMTVAEKVEQAVTHRPDSQVPGRAAERLLGLPPTGEAGLERRNWAMHIGMAAGVGALRGVMAFAGLRGPWASSMFTVIRLTADQIVENWTGVGAPPWTWPRDELAVDVGGKTVYAFVTGAVADRLAAAAGISPGLQHARLAGGRRVRDVGPVPGGRMYPRPA